MTARMVRFEQWGVNGFAFGGSIPIRNIHKYLAEFEIAAKKLLDESGADHVVYAWKRYDEHGNLGEVRFYEGTAIDDEEFYSRTDKLPGVVYALHKRK